MAKKFKKVISAMLSLLLILSVMPTVVLAEDTVVFYWDGDDKPSFTTKNMHLTYNKDVEGNFGKGSDNVSYKVYSNEGSTDHTITDKDAFQFHGTFSEHPSKDFVVSYSFAFTDKDDVIDTWFKYYDDVATSTSVNTFSNFAKITPNNICFAGKTTIPYNFDINKWYNIALVIDAENNRTFDNSTAEMAGSYTHKLYVNGVLIDSVHSTVPICVVYYSDMTSGKFHFGNGTDGDVIYYDDITLTMIENASNYTPSSVAVTLNENSDEISIENNSIIIPTTMTVAQLKELVTPSNNNARVKYYNSDYSEELSNDDKAIGANIVVTADEKTFNYYTAQKQMYNYGSNLFDGSTTSGLFSGVKGGDDIVPAALISTTTGINGKKSEDRIIMYTDASGGGYRQSANIVENATSIREVFELSFMLPSGSKYCELEISPIGSLNISSNGIYFKNDKCADISVDQWYNMAIVSPEATQYDESGAPISWGGDYELYLNGQIIKNVVEEGKHQIMYIRYRGGNDTGSNTPSVYFDNIRFTNEVYNPNYDKKAIVTGKGIDGKTISIIEGTSIADVKNALSFAEDTSMRVYDADYNLISDETQPMLNTYTVVFAAKNGTEMERSYSYYDVKYTNTLIDAEILNNGEIATGSYDTDDAITVNVNFKNFDERIHNVKLYVAQYNDGELVKLWSDDESVANDGIEKKLTVSLSDMTNRTGSSVKIILVNDDTQEPYIISKTLTCNVISE